MYDKFELFIDGEWRKGSGSATVFSPVTEKAIGEIATASAADTQAALAQPRPPHGLRTAIRHGRHSFALAASEAPFGGANHSGLGREGGPEGMEDYPESKLGQIVNRKSANA